MGGAQIGKTYLPRRRGLRARQSGRRRRKLWAWLFNLRVSLGRVLSRFRRRATSRVVGVGLLIAGLLFLGRLIFFSSLLSLGDVEINLEPAGGHDLERESLRQSIKKRLGERNLLTLRQKELDFLGENLSYGRFEIEKKWLRTLVVTIELRQPLAVAQDACGGTFLIDKLGVIFSSQVQESLPILRLPTQCVSLGEQVLSGGIETIISLISSLSAESFGVEWVEVTDWVRLQVRSGPQVDFYLEPEVGPKLLEILKNYRTQGVHLRKVDLRPRNPVLEY